jgi:hypothetical protein
MLLHIKVFQVVEITGCMNSDLSHLRVLDISSLVSPVQKLHKPTTFTTITGYLFALPRQTHFGSMDPSSLAVYLHIWFKHIW